HHYYSAPLSSFSFLFQYSRDHRDLHSFPTRRSSDLSAAAASWVDFQLKLQVCRLNQIQGLTGGVTRRDFIISMGVNVPPDIRRMVKDTVQRTLKLVV